ncbi:MAG: hypothetical protein ABID79_02915 [Elusimicrobiota bacterium]
MKKSINLLSWFYYSLSCYFYALVFLLFLLPAQSLLHSAFDDTGLNARPQGLGGAFTGISDDLNSVYYNPAGIGKINKHQVMFSYRDFYSLNLLTQNYVAFSVPGNVLNTAISIHRIGTTNNVEFDYTEDTYIVTLAGRVAYPKNLFCGVNFKFYRLFSESNASGWGLDTGLLYELFDKKLNLGLMLQNLNNSKIVWDTGVTDKLDINFRPGMSYSPIENLKIAFDYEKLKKLNSGIELLTLKKTIGLRAGINNLSSKKNIVAYGLSLNFNNLQFDWAFSEHCMLGYTHFFTLSIRAGK